MQERAARTRAAIIDAAATVFERQGFQAAKLDQIAAAAGVSKGALFFHFPSKAAVAAAVLEEHRLHWALLVGEVEARRLGLLDTIEALIVAMAEDYRDNPMARAGIRLGNEQQLIDAPLPTRFVGWVRYVGDLLRAGRARGEVRADLDPDAAARVIVGSFYGIEEVSAHLNERADLLDRVREWWALLRPTLAGADERNSEPMGSTPHST